MLERLHFTEETAATSPPVWKLDKICLICQPDKLRAIQERFEAEFGANAEQWSGERSFSKQKPRSPGFNELYLGASVVIL